MKLSKLIFALLLITAVSLPATADNNPERFVGLMQQYLELADQVVEAAQSNEAAVFLALEGISEVYREQGNAAAAAGHYQSILTRPELSLTVRNLVRFKLRDIYKDSRQFEKALEQLDLILAENS